MLIICFTRMFTSKICNCSIQQLKTNQDKMKMVKKNIHISMNTRVIVYNPSKIISSSLVKGKQVEDTKVIQKTADQTIKNN